MCSEQESPAVIKKQKKQPKNYVLIVVLRTECGFAIITIYIKTVEAISTTTTSTTFDDDDDEKKKAHSS